jgi:tetratricopeptide (TPR) repeat protein
MRGEFKGAAASYEQAIAADPQFAPAWRNLAVVSDLYLGDPGRALTALTHYQELTHEEKPVGSWIAELRQRLGLPPVKRPEGAPEAPAAQPRAAPAGAPGEAPPAAPGTTPGATRPNAATPSPGAGV